MQFSFQVESVHNGRESVHLLVDTELDVVVALIVHQILIRAKEDKFDVFRLFDAVPDVTEVDQLSVAVDVGFLVSKLENHDAAKDILCL